MTGLRRVHTHDTSMSITAQEKVFAWKQTIQQIAFWMRVLCSHKIVLIGKIKLECKSLCQCHLFLKSWRHANHLFAADWNESLSFKDKRTITEIKRAPLKVEIRGDKQTLAKQLFFSKKPTEPKVYFNKKGIILWADMAIIIWPPHYLENTFVWASWSGVVSIQRLRSCNLLVYCNTNQTQSVTTKCWKSYKIRLETENITENDEMLNTAGVNSASIGQLFFDHDIIVL